MNIFENEFIISEKLSSKELEILIITLQACNIRTASLNHMYHKDYPYVARSIYNWFMSSDYNYRNMKKITYEEVMIQLRNKIKDNVLFDTQTLENKFN